jgi:hypothetical protein
MGQKSKTATTTLQSALLVLSADASCCCCVCSAETTVAVRDSLGSWCKIEPDVFIVQQLDIGNMRIISQVLGQSVALDHYNR